VDEDVDSSHPSSSIEKKDGVSSSLHADRLCRTFWASKWWAAEFKARMAAELRGG